MAASTNTPAANTEDSLALGTAVDPETEKDILQLDAEENEASGRGDTEGMIDRMLADDTLLVNATGRIVTKPQLMAGIRHEFQKDPKRAATAPRPRHDEFWMRRFGDVVSRSGRSTTVNPDKSFGPMRRYMAVFAKRRGQWFVLGRQVIPIDHKRPPDSRRGACRHGEGTRLADEHDRPWHGAGVRSSGRDQQARDRTE